LSDIAHLSGRRTLVVGGGSGIGRAVVDAFRDAGASVGVLERDKAKCDELRSEFDDVAVVSGDATVLDDNHAAVAEVVDRFGGLEVLVNCVGVFDFYRRLTDLDEEEVLPAFDEIFRVNVASQLLSVKAALPALRAAHGCVVLTASTSAFAPGRGGVLYVASKFAVRGVVVALAHELAPDVRVNAVAPGGTVGTDLRGLEALGQTGEALADRPGREDELRSRTPLAVALTPADHAAAYVFLASDGAKGMTGTFLHSDGGVGVKG
jgi:NAD(P)-dependent dehydrogenase (short-subunit alcohol dehydrogenase family)